MQVPMTSVFRRVVSCALLGVVLVSGSAVNAQERSLVGAWDGSIQLPGSALAIHIEFTRGSGGSRGSGGYSGDIDIPAQGAVDMRLTSIELEGDVAVWTFPDVPGGATFEGEFSDDGNRIEGLYTQGAPFPFQIVRAEAAVHDAQSAFDDFPEHATRVMEARNVPGMAIAIVYKGEILYTEGIGLRDVEARKPVTPETLFAIGSATKAFTATVIGVLVDEGVLDFDEPVRSYLPDFKLYDEDVTNTLTLRDMLSHRSGLPRHDLVWYGSTATREELYHRLPYLEPSAELRQTWQYQNLMFMTAGYLAGQVTGSTWEDLVRERLFKPLSISYANFSVREMGEVEDAARGYSDAEDGGFELMDYRDIIACGPAGSINANVLEMTNWVRLQLDQGEFLGKRVVSSSTMADLHAPQMVMGGKKDSVTPYSMYAMGWMVEPYRGHDLLHHGGNIDGFSALITFLPDDDLGVVVLTNKNGTAVPKVLTYDAIDRALGLTSMNHDQRAGPPPSLLAASGDSSPESGRVEGTSASHELADYAGKYEHPGYGELLVGFEDGALTVLFGPFDEALEHWHYDTFSIGGGTLGSTKLTFETDAAGDIAGVTIPFEPSVAPIRFVPVGSDRLSDPEFLATLVGEYSLSGGKCTVSLSGRRLSVTVPAQPTYALEPHRGTSFRLRGLSGYSVEFVIEDDIVRALVFHQPNGVFRAERQDARVAQEVGAE